MTRAQHLARLTPEGVDLFCFACSSWFPAGLSFWNPLSGLRCCRACTNEKQRIARQSPERRAYVKRWREQNAEKVRAWEREAYKKRRERVKREVQALSRDESGLRSLI